MILHPAKQNQVWARTEIFSNMQEIISLTLPLLENYLRICLNDTNKLSSLGFLKAELEAKFYRQVYLGLQSQGAEVSDRESTRGEMGKPKQGCIIYLFLCHIVDLQYCGSFWCTAK